jgi:glyoxylase-like metal-dependent hydrolase (beta-lactamase superfamily II)
MDTAVHLLDRGRIDADLNFVLDGHVVATASDPNPELDYGTFAVWNLVVDHPEATVLFDTGSHPDAGDGYWPAPLFEAFAHHDAGERDLKTALDDAGFSLSDIDAVVMSHLHLDHAGGLYHFAGTDTPVYVHEEELKFAYYSAKTDQGSVAYWAPDFDHDLDWRVVLVAGDTAYLDPNYEAGHSMASSLLYDNRAWADSVARVKERERQTGADVLLGHDLGRFERFAPGWNVG